MKRFILTATTAIAIGGVCLAIVSQASNSSGIDQTRHLKELLAIPYYSAVFWLPVFLYPLLVGTSAFQNLPRGQDSNPSAYLWKWLWGAGAAVLMGGFIARLFQYHELFKPMYFRTLRGTWPGWLSLLVFTTAAYVSLFVGSGITAFLRSLAFLLGFAALLWLCLQSGQTYPISGFVVLSDLSPIAGYLNFLFPTLTFLLLTAGRILRPDFRWGFSRTGIAIATGCVLVSAWLQQQAANNVVRDGYAVKSFLFSNDLPTNLFQKEIKATGIYLRSEVSAMSGASLSPGSHLGFYYKPGVDSETQSKRFLSTLWYGPETKDVESDFMSIKPTRYDAEKQIIIGTVTNGSNKNDERNFRYELQNGKFEWKASPERDGEMSFTDYSDCEKIAKEWKSDSKSWLCTNESNRIWTTAPLLLIRSNNPLCSSSLDLINEIIGDYNGDEPLPVGTTIDPLLGYIYPPNYVPKPKAFDAADDSLWDLFAKRNNMPADMRQRLDKYSESSATIPLRPASVPFRSTESSVTFRFANGTLKIKDSFKYFESFIIPDPYLGHFAVIREERIPGYWYCWMHVSVVDSKTLEENYVGSLRQTVFSENWSRLSALWTESGKLIIHKDNELYSLNTQTDNQFSEKFSVGYISEDYIDMTALGGDIIMFEPFEDISGVVCVNFDKNANWSDSTKPWFAKWIPEEFQSLFYGGYYSVLWGFVE